MKKTVFASGSCRLLTVIRDGRGKVNSLHSMIRNYTGPNFLGKLHNTRQHIQFLRWIRGDITIPDDILSQFLVVHSSCKYARMREGPTPPEKRLRNITMIKNGFDACDVYIFEICSMKLYQLQNYEVQCEILTSEVEPVIQTVEELLEDLHTICSMIPSGKPIIFQCHFRPNVIYNDESKIIVNRERIYHTLKEFCSTHDNVFLYDPSELLLANKRLFDGEIHLTRSGLIASFNHINNKYIEPIVQT